MVAPAASEPRARPRPERWLGGLVGLTVLVVMAGCASGAKVIEVGDEVKLLVAPRADSGDDALLKGELTVLGGCVGVADTVVIWPHGTTALDGQELRITVPDLGTFALGDEVAIGGGMAQEPPARRGVEVAGVSVPAACAEHLIWMSSPAS